MKYEAKNPVTEKQKGGPGKGKTTEFLVYNKHPDAPKLVPEMYHHEGNI